MGATNEVKQVADWLRLLIAPGTVTELRALRCRTAADKRPHTRSGYFDFEHLDQMAELAMTVTKWCEGVYWMLNPIRPDLLARRANRIDFAPKGETTEDADIIARRWLLVDCDPVRPAGVSATDDEKSAAKDVAMRVREWMTSEGAPLPVFADSGNGFHLLFRIDDIATGSAEVMTEGTKWALHCLARRFDCDQVKIDTSVFNPARICKLYGTWARKGDSTTERPHRKAAILEVP